ncbi:MAG: hypothetical protein ACK5M3_13045 [Dysgonomonas sp.]
MNIKFLTVLFFLSIFSELFGQDDIRLNSTDPKNKQTVNVKLHDASNGNLLMELPLTFHIMKAEERNILFVIVGKKPNQENAQTVWMFKEALQLDDLLKKNRNLRVEKDFRKKSDLVESLYENSHNINLIDFHDEYERFLTVSKPLFFEVKDISKPFELKLKFYVSVPDKDETIQILTAKAGIVRVTIDITN